MWWIWRQRPPGRHWRPPAPIPDGDRVHHPDGRDARLILADLLAPDYRAVGRAAVPAPVEQVEQVELPLMTRGQEWRADGGRR